MFTEASPLPLGIHSILGNLYSRLFGGTAFTSMVPGVLFLVPVRHLFFFEVIHARILTLLDS